MLNRIFALFLALFAITAGAMECDFIIDGLSYVIKDSHSVSIVNAYELHGNKNVTIPGRVNYCGKEYLVKSIEDKAFMNCLIETVNIPEPISHIGEMAFYGCSNLSKIVLPATLIDVGKMAFWDCTAAIEISSQSLIPPSLGFRAFPERKENDIMLMRTLFVPKKAMKAYQGSSWSNLFQETVPACFPEIYSGGLYYKINNDGASLSVTRDINAYDGGDVYFVMYNNYKNLKSVRIPESISYNGRTYTVTGICRHAFHNSNITNLFIPSTVTSIGVIDIFDDEHCYNSQWEMEWDFGDINISIDANNPVYDSRDNCNAIIETATNTMLTSNDMTRVPSSVTCLATCKMFYGKDRIIIPKGVQKISFVMAEAYAKSLILPEGLVEIGDNAFGNLYYVEKVTIPTTVKKIGSFAFGGGFKVIIGYDETKMVCDEYAFPEGAKKIEKQSQGVARSKGKKTRKARR